MLNMNVSEMILVNPIADHLSTNAKNFAVHAIDVLENARVVNSLSEAVSGAEISIAVSRRVGQWRKRDFWLPELATYMKEYRDKKVVLVFGREKHGLTNEEIQSCDLVCTIPSSERFPSLNLSHAVLVVLYEIYKVWETEDIEARNAEIASKADFNVMEEDIMWALGEFGFFHYTSKDSFSVYVNKILKRSHLGYYDTVVIRNLFRRMGGIVKGLKKKKNFSKKIDKDGGL